MSRCFRCPASARRMLGLFTEGLSRGVRTHLARHRTPQSGAAGRTGMWCGLPWGQLGLLPARIYLTSHIQRYPRHRASRVICLRGAGGNECCQGSRRASPQCHRQRREAAPKAPRPAGKKGEIGGNQTQLPLKKKKKKKSHTRKPSALL